MPKIGKLNIDLSKEGRKQWIVFIGVFFMCFSAMGLGSNSFGLFTVPITEALGLPRAEYNLFETISKVVGSITAACFSGIYRKIGPKGAVLVAGSAYAIQYLCFAMATDMTLIMVGGFVSGIGYTFAAQMTIFAIIPPWFKKTTGTMTSILSACNTFGTTFWTFFLTQWLAKQGYKTALIYSAIIMVVMCVISSFLVKAHPDDTLAGKNAKKGGKKEEAEEEQAFPMLTNKELIKLPHQWCLILIYFIVAAIGHPFTANIPAFADAKGLDPAIGAAGYAMCYAIMGPAKIVVGVLKDRFGVKLAVPFVFGCFIIACLAVLLPVSGGMYTWMTGVGHGVGGTMSQLVIAFVVLETFGKYYHPGQLGLCLVVFNIGRAIGMPAIHLEYDATGSYAITSVILIVCAVAVVTLTFMAMKFGKKWQEKRDQQLVEMGLTPPVDPRAKKAEEAAEA